jgi:hypothetical protein
MKGNILKTLSLAGVSLLAFGATISMATQQARAAADRPMFSVQPIPRAEGTRITEPPLPTWTYSWSYNGASGSEVFIGNEPTSGAASTIPVVIIPLKTVYGTTTEDPLKTLSGGRSVIASIVDSPIFQSQTYIQGGTNVGDTQYIDAFQRASLWYGVSSNPGYHVTFAKPEIAPVQTITVPKADGSIATDFGAHVVQAYINYWDTQLQDIIAKLKIPAGALPIFISSNVYLTELPKALCCIGGYHSYNGTNTYSFATYVTTPGAFAQDVSALSHELGEWIQDPFTNNSGCTGLWEVGDPLENNANYGGYPYSLNGFTYNLQDLVLPPYFGTDPTTSVNGFSTFQGESLAVCQNGP